MKNNMIDGFEEYKWNLSFLPTIDNKFHHAINRMNRYGKLIFPYNQIAGILREIIIEKYLKIDSVHFDYDFFCLFGNLHGKSVWFTNTYILDYAPVYFGEHITIGPDVKIITSWHETENFNIVKALPIHIEDNVWITMNAIILPGVRIGKNSIVAAGSVVTKSMPPNSLIGGNPAKVIKTINRDYKYWEDMSLDVDKRNSNTLKPKLYITIIPRIIKKIIKKILKKII